jgi:hypothetical protein
MANTTQIVRTKCTLYEIDQDGILYKPEFYPYFTIEELKHLSDSIELTLKRYLDLGLTDNQINKLNENECEKRIKEMSGHRNYQKNRIEMTNIYLMLDENTGYHKIGRSKNPNKRERTLQSEKPTISLFYHCEVPAKIESILHEKYKDYRVRGEWFDLDEEQINEIVEYLESKRIVCQGGTTK